ncbi:MAG: pectate lyase [Thermoguttaceae bacterium]
MFTPQEQDRIRTAYKCVRDELLKQRDTSGHWIGELSSSALSTATAVSALSIYRQKCEVSQRKEFTSHEHLAKIHKLIKNGATWLIATQNSDGGWGDTPESPSNPSTTLLVKSALLLSDTVSVYEPHDKAGHSARDSNSDSNARDKSDQIDSGIHSPYHDSIHAGWSMGVLTNADVYIRNNGGIEGIEKRYGTDRTFSAPILANAALAGLVPWRDVPQLPFELAAFPQSMFKLLRLPVVSYAIPALVAIGQLIFENQPSLGPLKKLIRNKAKRKSLEKVGQMQPESGGFLEAAPLTSFVVMSLASLGHIDHPVVNKGLEFLYASVRKNGAWPIDTNLATWLTTLSVNAIFNSDLNEENSAHPEKKCDSAHESLLADTTLWDWILQCQTKTKHPFTGASPGGWAWTDLSGGVPDADDTPGALISLANYVKYQHDAENINNRVIPAAINGLQWLLDLQNRDGGMPTFCKGWNRFPFDKSGVDLTAHALRAFLKWRDILADTMNNQNSYDTTRVNQTNGSEYKKIIERLNRAINKGVKFIVSSQKHDGSWLPLWFGNQYHSREENPIYGTAKTLKFFSEYISHKEFSRKFEIPIINGIKFIISNQNEDGGYGCRCISSDDENTSCKKRKASARKNRSIHFDTSGVSSIEETALVVDGITAFTQHKDVLEDIPQLEESLKKSIFWLVSQIEERNLSQTAPIGLYFTKLWYDEKLYPPIFTTSALGEVLKSWNEL